ncbi:MAG: VTT domain-containing protein [Candidatus Nomurabacteria bacterium]|nr:VTT domain-containing protein [Candidatus Nomurabacteria bacterium]
MHTVNLLIGLVEHHQVLVYAVIFLGLIVEGEFFLISTGILTHLGALNFWIALIFVLLGALSKTFLGYALGEFLFKKYNHHRFFRYIQRRVYSVLPRFKAKPFWSIFISKFLVGINHVVIVFCGFEKIDYKKYLKAEISATIIWAPLLLSLGYFFSFTALHVSQKIGRFSMVVLGLFILYIILDKFIGWVYEIFEEFYDNEKD